MAKKSLPASQSLLALLDEHNATNAAIKITAVAMNRLEESPPKDGREFSKAMGGWIKGMHASWGAAHLARSRIPEATDWIAGAALVRAIASFEEYTQAMAARLSVSPATEEGDDADKTCLSVRIALATVDELGIAGDELKELIDLCEVLNWFAAIRNAVCHGNSKIASARQAHAQHAWSRIHNYFGFADDNEVPTFPKHVNVTWPLVLLASSCGYRIAQRLDGPTCSKHGTKW